MKLKTLLNEVKIPKWKKEIKPYDLGIDQKLISRGTNIICALNNDLKYNSLATFLSKEKIEFDLKENNIAIIGSKEFTYVKFDIENVKNYIKTEPKNFFNSANKLISGNSTLSGFIQFSSFGQSKTRWPNNNYIDEIFDITNKNDIKNLIDLINRNYASENASSGFVLDLVVILEGSYNLIPSEIDKAKIKKYDFKNINDLEDQIMDIITIAGANNKIIRVYKEDAQIRLSIYKLNQDNKIDELIIPISVKRSGLKRRLKPALDAIEDYNNSIKNKKLEEPKLNQNKYWMP